MTAPLAEPETRYAKSGDVFIAYQTLGTGPLDVVVVQGFTSHLEHMWEEPRLAAFYRQFASFARVILVDKRGTGLSDRVPHAELPTLEQRVDDLRTVLDADGSERPAMMGFWEGGAMTALFACWTVRPRVLNRYVRRPACAQQVSGATSNRCSRC